MSVDLVVGSWAGIDRWLDTHTPATSRLLRPPVEPAALVSLREVVGVDLPDELVASLSCHDGEQQDDWTGVLPFGRLLSAEEIGLAWRMSMEVAAEEAGQGFTVQPWEDEPWWHPAWLPWASSDGDFTVVDTRNGSDRLGGAGHSGGGDFTEGWPGIGAALAAVERALATSSALTGEPRAGRPFVRQLPAPAGALLWWGLDGDTHLGDEPLLPCPTLPS